MDRGWIFRYWGRRLVKYEGNILCAQHANSPHCDAINQEKRRKRKAEVLEDLPNPGVITAPLSATEWDLAPTQLVFS